MKNRNLLPLIFAAAIFTEYPALSQSTFEKHEVAKPFARSAGLRLADPDRDGDLDILAGSGTSGLYWYENQGGKPLKWQSHTVDASIRGCLSIATGDLDKDGIPDLAATSWDDNSLVWYRNPGNQVWERKLISSQCANAHELFIHDMDGDGYDDILVAAVANNEVLLFHNPGTGSTTWSRQQVSNSCGGSRSVSAADLDADGLQDIVGAAFTGNKITIWRNLGGNPVQWQPVDLVTGFGGAHRVEITDLNRDGKPDIIGWAYTLGALRWWENTGSDFSAWIMHTVDNQLNTALVGEAKDIDLDGDLDIVSTGSLSNLVVWYENTDGKGNSWKKHNIDTGLTEPWMAYAGDLDGDIDVDVIAGGDGGNEIRWYENHPAGRMDTYLNFSGGKMNVGIYLPEGYDESVDYELLIALPGAGDPKLFSVFRDYFIPVSHARNTIILAPNFDKAAAPDYEFTNPGQIDEVIGYAGTRFSIDTTRIYLLGAGCQGKPVLQGTHAAQFHVKGAIGINPEITGLNTDEWMGTSSPPLAIAASQSDPLYPSVRQFSDQLWRMGNLIKLIPFDGPGADYLVDSLADITLRCMNYIDSANFLSKITIYDAPALAKPSIRLIGSGSEARLCISAFPGELLHIQMIDLSGRTACSVYLGSMDGQYMELPLNDEAFLESGIKLIRVTGSKSGTSSIKVYLNLD